MSAAATFTELVGGPLDSRLIPRRAAAFVWVQVSADKERTLAVFEAKAAGRLLYRRMDDGTYIYAGHQFERCDRCGGMVTKPHQCAKG